MQSFGRRLMQIRLASGFQTITDFAACVGIDEDTLSKVEVGTRPGLTMQNLAKIKRATGYTIDFLVDDDKRGLTRTQIQELADAETEIPAAEAKERRGRRRPRSA